MADKQKLVAKVRLTHRAEPGARSQTVEVGEEFEASESDAETLIRKEQAVKATTAEGKKLAAEHEKDQGEGDEEGVSSEPVTDDVYEADEGKPARKSARKK